MPRSHKRVIILLAAIVLILAALFVLLRLLLPPALNNPESVAYDATGKRFLISNNGNGTILSLDGAGRYKRFLTGLDSPRGLKVVGSKLYVADGTQIRAIDLKAPKLNPGIALPGAKRLNDIESDEKGLLYVTDTEANKLFILDPATKKSEALESPLLQAPNGLVYDYPRHQMLIVCYRAASPVLAFNVDKHEFGVFRETLYDNLDGIAIDDLGRIYFSSWGEKSVLRIPQEQNRTQIWQSAIDSPADIYYHQLTNEIIVPVFDKNEIRRFRVEP